MLDGFDSESASVEQLKQICSADKVAVRFFSQFTAAVPTYDIVQLSAEEVELVRAALPALRDNQVKTRA